MTVPPRSGRPLDGERPDPLALSHTDWLRHELIVTAPAEDVAALRAAAAGAGAIRSADWTPWVAIRTLRQRWPDAVFDVRPDDGDD